MRREDAAGDRIGSARFETNIPQVKDSSRWEACVMPQRNKFEELSMRRKRAHARLLAMKSKVYEGFLAMESAAYASGVLEKKQKELIAVGISVVKDCESCMQWHIEQAAASGARYEEIFEAIEVGIEMGGGPATVSARFALEAMDAIGLKPGRG
jgi:AhpD family alkylhydroperoxidase